MNLLHTIGLMTRAEHERIVADNDEKAYEAWAKIADERDDMKLSRDDWQQKHNSVVGKLKRALDDLAAQAEEIARLKADFDITLWKHCVGDPPDYQSPLGCVYDSGVSYAYARLAEWLGVTDYEMGDGSECYATDVGRTGANVLVAAGFVNDDGDLLTSEDMAALKADAEAMRKKRAADRKRMAGKRNG